MDASPRAADARPGRRLSREAAGVGRPDGRGVVRVERRPRNRADVRLPRFVDRSFRTIPSRRARGVVGLSAGGYGATLLAVHHLESFAVVESWSGYFHPTNPSGTEPLDVGSKGANARASVHTYVRTLRDAFRRRSTFFAFYVGRADSRFRDENLELHRELVAARVPHVFRLYPGAHAQTVWSAHATAWLQLVLAHMTPAG